MSFILNSKSRYWKLLPKSDADKTAQAIAITTTDRLMIGIPRKQGEALFLNYENKQTVKQMLKFRKIATAIYFETKETFLKNHEQYDWFVTHEALTSSGLSVTVLSPF